MQSARVAFFGMGRTRQNQQKIIGGLKIMKKTLIIALMALTLLLSLVSAQEAELVKLTNVITKSAESQGTTFSFITGTSGQSRVGSLHIYTTAGTIPATLGGACSEGQYVVAYQCEYSSGTNCQRMFTDDWKMDTSTDYLPYSNWQNQQWFKDVLVYKKYAAYECLAAKTTATDTQLYGKPTGVFTSVIWPKSPVSDSTTIHIKGQYKVIGEGYFVLEAGIDPRATTTFAVITASSSICDGSAYYAGKKLYGKAGDIYDFDFTVRVPEPSLGKSAYYNMLAHAWTDCSKNGGTEIVSKTASLLVQNTGWTASKCGSTDRDNDGVYDNCDVCPMDIGIPEMQGCHPCFGLSLDLQSTKDCYYKYQDKYGIPIIVLDYIDPYVKTVTLCKNSNTQVATVKIRQSGLQSTVAGSTITCTSPQVCIQATAEAASCQTPKAPEAPKVTETGKEAVCEGGDKVVYSVMSDGTKIYQGTFDCLGNGCENGACTQPPDPNPDLTDAGAAEEDEGASLQEPECTTTDNCAPGYYCFSGSCAPKQPSAECTTDADCKDSAKPKCSLMAGACVSAPTVECTTDSDCSSKDYCSQTQCNCVHYEFDALCVPNEPLINEETGAIETCTQNEVTTCSDGSSVITAACKDGQLYKLAANCVASTTETPTTNSLGDQAGNFFQNLFKTGSSGITSTAGPSTTIDKTNWKLIIGVVAVIVVALVLIQNPFKKKKGRRR